MHWWIGILCALQAAATQVTLRKIANDECGQATIEKKFEDLACKFAGFEPGNCSAKDYTILEGTNNLELPLLGAVNVSLFKKGDMLSSLKNLGTELAGQLVGLEDGGGAGFCCKTCAAPLLKYHSWDAALGQCGETCIHPGQAWLFKKFKANLTFAKDLSCANLSFGKYKKTVTHGVPPIAITVDLYEPGAERDLVILHKITSNECGQVLLDRKYKESLVRFAGFREGMCYDQGYTVDQKLKVPFKADVKLALFKKPGHLTTFETLRVTMGALAQPKPNGAGKHNPDYMLV